MCLFTPILCLPVVGTVLEGGVQIPMRPEMWHWEAQSLVWETRHINRWLPSIVVRAHIRVSVKGATDFVWQASQSRWHLNKSFKDEKDFSQVGVHEAFLYPGVQEVGLDKNPSGLSLLISNLSNWPKESKGLAQFCGSWLIAEGGLEVCFSSSFLLLFSKPN